MKLYSWTSSFPVTMSEWNWHLRKYKQCLLNWSFRSAIIYFYSKLLTPMISATFNQCIAVSVPSYWQFPAWREYLQCVMSIGEPAPSPVALQLDENTYSVSWVWGARPPSLLHYSDENTYSVSWILGYPPPSHVALQWREYLQCVVSIGEPAPLACCITGLLLATGEGLHSNYTPTMLLEPTARLIFITSRQAHIHYQQTGSYTLPADRLIFITSRQGHIHYQPMGSYSLLAVTAREY